MPLEFTGECVSTLTGTDYAAKGSKFSEPITVKVSHEALQDWGEDRMRRKANEKYDADQMASRVITIRRSDFSDK